MTTAPTKGERTRERILDVAAAALRRHGHAGVSIADVMREAGLTHGGFYAHFENREALLAAALERASRSSGAALQASLDAQAARGREPLQALIRSYLSMGHRDAPEGGCPVAALGAEWPRQGEAVQAAGAGSLHRLAERVRGLLPEGVGPAAVPMVCSALVGGLQMARALPPDEAEAWLRQCREALWASVQRLADPAPPG